MPAPESTTLTTPPRSRHISHLATVIVTPLLLAVALLLLARIAGWELAAGGSAGPAAGRQILTVAGAGLCVLLAAASAGWSTLGLSLAGTLLAVVGTVTLLTSWPVTLPDWLPVQAAGVHHLAHGAWSVVLGLVALAVAAGVHGARRAGRQQERDDAAGPRRRGRASTAAPPRSRMPAHLLAALTGTIAVPGALLAVQTVRAETAATTWQWPDRLLVLAALLALTAVAFSLRFSSLGALAGSGVTLATLVAVAVSQAVSDTTPQVSTLARIDAFPAFPPFPGEFALSLALAVLLLGGGLAAHRARSAGRRRERHEQHLRTG